jgi:hypothetical protein
MWLISSCCTTSLLGRTVTIYIYIYIYVIYIEKKTKAKATAERQYNSRRTYCKETKKEKNSKTDLLIPIIMDTPPSSAVKNKKKCKAQGGAKKAKVVV